MNKLIKLSDTHYIVVDDSEIKQNDIVCEKLLTGGYELFTIQTLNDIDTNNQFKITHSTQPLEMRKVNSLGSEFAFLKIKPLSLSEVEEAIYGYNVERLAREFATKPVNPLNSTGTITCLLSQNGFEKGYNKSQETHPFSEEDVRWIFAKAIELSPSTESHTRMISDSQYRNFILDSLYVKVLQLWKEQKPKIVYYA